MPDNRYNILIAYLRIISLFNVTGLWVCSIFWLHAPGEGALLEDGRPRVYFRPRKPWQRVFTSPTLPLTSTLYKSILRTQRYVDCVTHAA